MMSKLLIWTSALLVFLGVRSVEGHLFFFFALLLATAAIGRYFHRREPKTARLEALPSAAGGSAPQGKVTPRGRS